MRTSKDTKINNKIELFMLKALGYIVLLLILYKTIIVFSQENLILVLYCILYGSGLFFSILLLLETYGFQFKIINRFAVINPDQTVVLPWFYPREQPLSEKYHGVI